MSARFLIYEKPMRPEEDATTISKEINAILDLILTKGMQLEQYDQIIENQNTVIVKMKGILNTVEKI